MKVSIESAQPDGLLVRFLAPFHFDTWEEAFAFIRAVERLEHLLPEANKRDSWGSGVHLLDDDHRTKTRCGYIAYSSQFISPDREKITCPDCLKCLEPTKPDFTHLVFHDGSGPRALCGEPVSIGLLVQDATREQVSCPECKKMMGEKK